MDENRIKLRKAREKVKRIKLFYLHFIVYLVVNLIIFIFNITTSSEYLWFIWPVLIWGAFILADAFSVFGFDKIFGKDWEEKKIKRIMEKE